MEKHSDWLKPELINDGRAFFGSMLEKTASFDTPSVMCAMNQLSNHDHSRFLTRTNRTPGRLETSGSAAAGKGIDKNVFAEAVVVQMTWPGSPAIYYADEAGQIGWTDPDSRRTFPWGREDRNLIDLHRELISLRKRCPALINGSMKPLLGTDGVIAFARFTENSFVFTVCNNSTQEKKVRLRLRDVGVHDGQKINRVFISGTGEKGFSSSRMAAGEVTDGYIEIVLPAVSASVYEKENGNEA